MKNETTSALGTLAARAAYCTGERFAAGISRLRERRTGFRLQASGFPPSPCLRRLIPSSFDVSQERPGSTEGKEITWTR
jgi:hypothetical protein